MVPIEINTYRIFAVDPGKMFMGIAIIDVDIVSGQCHVIYAQTIKGKDLLKQFAFLIETHQDVVAVMHGHFVNFCKVLDRYSPHCVVIESPFLGRFPAAFKSLILCVESLQKALLLHNDRIPLEKIDPPSVKNAVGVKGKSKDKEDIRDALRKNTNILYCEEVDLEQLDEHSCDAIAVAIWAYEQRFGKRQEKTDV